MSLPSFVGSRPISAVEPRSRRLFKAPRRSIPERVPSKGASALHRRRDRMTLLEQRRVRFAPCLDRELSRASFELRTPLSRGTCDARSIYRLSFSSLSKRGDRRSDASFRLLQTIQTTLHRTDCSILSRERSTRLTPRDSLRSSPDEPTLSCRDGPCCFTSRTGIEHLAVRRLVAEAST
jgi:hypothetical protein